MTDEMCQLSVLVDEFHSTLSVLQVYKNEFNKLIGDREEIWLSMKSTLQCFNPNKKL